MLRVVVWIKKHAVNKISVNVNMIWETSQLWGLDRKL